MKKIFEIYEDSGKGAELSTDSMAIRVSVQDGRGIQKRAEEKYHGHQ